MCLHSESVRCFQHFKTMVENILIPRLNTFEVMRVLNSPKDHSKASIDSYGIVFRLSCPQTFEQNGLAERKHRYISKMGLTLLLQASLPQKHWMPSLS